MTRFEREISGLLGAYWKASAERELAEIEADIEAGRITIDANGVARNCIGRALMADMAERVAYINNDIDLEATAAAREAEVSIELAAYRRAAKAPTEAELREMRATFGPGATVVDVITGAKIQL